MPAKRVVRARSRRTRRKHLVTADFRIPPLDMEDSSLELRLRSGGHRIGEMSIGRRVTATFRDLSLTKTGSALYLRLKAGGRTLGVVEIGRGSLWWSGKGARRLRTRKTIRWTDFAKMMNRLAYGTRRRRRG